MEAILTKNDAWGYVSGDKVKPEIVAGNAESVEAARAWDVEDKKAKSDIVLAIKSSKLKHVAGSLDEATIDISIQWTRTEGDIAEAVNAAQDSRRRRRARKFAQILRYNRQTE